MNLKISNFDSSKPPYHLIVIEAIQEDPDQEIATLVTDILEIDTLEKEVAPEEIEDIVEAILVTETTETTDTEDPEAEIDTEITVTETEDTDPDLEAMRTEEEDEKIMINLDSPINLKNFFSNMTELSRLKSNLFKT